MAEETVTQLKPAPVSDIQDLRFDRALVQLSDKDPNARVSLDTKSGLANGVDGSIHMEMPPAAQDLPGTDRAAAAAVLFLDEFGDLFGIPGWHVLTPESASPLGRTMWFGFRVKVGSQEFKAHVAADEQTIKNVRIDRNGET